MKSKVGYGRKLKQATMFSTRGKGVMRLNTLSSKSHLKNPCALNRREPHLFDFLPNNWMFWNRVDGRVNHALMKSWEKYKVFQN